MKARQIRLVKRSVAAGLLGPHDEERCPVHRRDHQADAAYPAARTPKGAGASGRQHSGLTHTTVRDRNCTPAGELRSNKDLVEYARLLD